MESIFVIPAMTRGLGQRTDAFDEFDHRPRPTVLVWKTMCRRYKGMIDEFSTLGALTLAADRVLSAIATGHQSELSK